MRILLIIGPSGAGKSHLERILTQKKHAHIFNKVVSHTTRERRKGEQYGRHYYFTSTDFFYEEKENFLEQVVFNGNSYGVHKSSLSENNLINVIVVEPEGARQIVNYCKKYNHTFNIIYMTLGSEQLEQVLVKRDGNANRLSDGIVDKYDSYRRNFPELEYDLNINKRLGERALYGVVTNLLGVDNAARR